MDLMVKAKETCSFNNRWIEGHTGKKGQKLIDSIAKEAARESNQTGVTDVTLKDVQEPYTA